MGKTSWCHYKIGYHLVWIPKYRRKILTGAVETETKKLIVQCCEQHDLTLLALETDQDHVHIFVSAPPGSHPQLLRDCSKGTLHALFERSSYISRSFAGKSTSGHVRILLEQRKVYQQKSSDAISLNARGNNRKGKRRRFHPNPLEGMGLPASLLLITMAAMAQQYGPNQYTNTNTNK